MDRAAYESYCPDCKSTYYWEDFEVGQTDAQREKLHKDKTICKYCSSHNLQTRYQCGPEPEPDIAAFTARVLMDHLSKRD